VLQSVDAPTIDRVWALPPWVTLGCILKVFEFGHSRHPQRWDPFVIRDTTMDNGYIEYTYIYMYSSSLMVGFSSLYLSLWPLSDLLEHYEVKDVY